MGEECEAKILGSPEAQVVQTQLKISMKSPLLVCCFPSAGVIGTIAANTMIEQFEMEEVAHVRSRYMP
ncbi:MAG: PAC2 family protein, partial [Candidatus Thorarchaeota archaeon]